MTKEEKLAEEYVSNKADKGNYDIEQFGKAYFSESSMKQAVLFGLKAGKDMNVPTEWHYVKDGDLPKDGVQVLSEKGLLVFYKGDCFCWFEYSPNADNIRLRKWEEPYAWKEIVLPELKES